MVSDGAFREGVAPAAPASSRLGKYVVFDELAAGGQGTVHLGRLEGSGRFSRVVVLKRLRSWAAEDGAALRDEAWLTARIRHPNVVTMLDLIEDEGTPVLVMEYVEGASLAELLSAGKAIPASVIGAIVHDLLSGLAAAHAARAEDGTPLDLVHRDVSPHNVLIGIDGIARLTDFGVAKARGRLIQTTHEGEIKGKFAYMAPEQVSALPVSAQTDLYAAGVVLFECLANRRLHKGDDPGAIVTSILYGKVPAIAPLRHDVPAAVDDVITKALQRAPNERYADATQMAAAIERVLGRADAREVAAFLREVLGEKIAKRVALREAIERSATSSRGSLTEPTLLSGMPYTEVLPATAIYGGVVPPSVPPPNPPVAGSRRRGWSTSGIVAMVFGLATAFPVAYLALHRRPNPVTPATARAMGTDTAAAPISLMLDAGRVAESTPLEPVPTVSAISQPSPSSRPSLRPRAAAPTRANHNTSRPTAPSSQPLPSSLDGIPTDRDLTGR